MRRLYPFVIAALVLTGCEGDPGPTGPPGADGQDYPGPAPQAYVNADGIMGGAAYSTWWATAAGGTGLKPSTTAAADFYRCKACHAWDGMGNAASYANRTGQSTLTPTRPDVSSVNLRSTASINFRRGAVTHGYQGMFDLVRHVGARSIDASDNSHPDYSAYLTDAQVWNIVKFMREEWVNPNLLYDIEVSGPTMYVDYSADPDTVVAPTITYSNIGALGNEANGQSTFAAKCGNGICHGPDGTNQNIDGMSLGEFVRAKPNEAWFKAKFGEPGAGMDPGLVTTTSDLQDLYRALANPATFPDIP